MGKKVNKKYKDRLFRFIFGDRRELLTLYNALNGTDYKDADKLEIVTLEDVIYMNMKNDVAFLFGAELNLWEHQSSRNPNMPVRGLFYFARLYKKYAKRHKLNLYSSRLQSLPYPQYIVFYNGREDEPDRKVLRLSDAFAVAEDGAGETISEDRKAVNGTAGSHGSFPEPCVEVTATMLNINLGRNRELMRQCRRLEEYATFVEMVREQLDMGQELETAVREAVRRCLRKGILADILVEHTEEVVEMFLTDYDFEEHMKLEREENYAVGHADGKEEGKAEGKAEAICDMLEDIGSLPDEWRHRIMSEENLDTLKEWLKIARRAESPEDFFKKSGLDKFM